MNELQSSLPKGRKRQFYDSSDVLTRFLLPALSFGDSNSPRLDNQAVAASESTDAGSDAVS